MNRPAMHKRDQYIELSLAQRGIIVTPGHALVLANSPAAARLYVALNFRMSILLLSTVLRPEPGSASFAAS
jgi:hypothetical protein